MANHNPHIPRIERPANDMPVRFSFKHLDLNNQKFLPSECRAEYFVKLFETLRRFSNWTIGDFIDQHNTEHRHTIDFDQTSEPDGFQRIPGLDADQFGYYEGWQFGVHLEDRGNRWRAHGILIDDTFYIIWLDEHHRLYPLP
jgi:hypothetical protein